MDPCWTFGFTLCEKTATLRDQPFALSYLFLRLNNPFLTGRPNEAAARGAPKKYGGS